MSRHTIVAVAVALVLVLAGAASARATTVAQYQARANAICVAESKQLNALPSTLGLATYLPRALIIARSAYTALTKLSPPAAIAPLHARLIANIRAGFPIVQGLLVRAKAGKLTIAQFENDRSLGANAAAENALWKQLGAKKCLT